MPKKQTDGRYRAKITVGVGPDGNTVYKYVSGKTKRELEEAKAEARAHYIDGAEQRADMLFGTYALEWYHARKEPNLSESSKAGYANYFNTHLLPAWGDRNMRSIQALELQRWINGYAGKSKTLISMLVAIMKSVLSSAYAEGIIARDPSVSLVRSKASKADSRRALTEDECAGVERAIMSSEYGLFLGVLYYLGLRRGEALGLRWGDFDWIKNLVNIERDVDFTGNNKGNVGDLKTPAAHRQVPVPPQLLELLREKRGLPNIYLFGTSSNGPLSYSTYERRWMQLMIDSGLATPVDYSKEDCGKKPKSDIRYDWTCEITPHYLRHTYITKLYEAGVDPLVAMRLVGHADYKTTAQIYTHLNETHIQKAQEKISDVFGGKKVARKLPDVKNKI